MVESRKLFLYKAAALLHDPPHKAWVVLNRRVLAGKGGSRKAHEEEAFEFARLVLAGTRLEGALQYLASEVVAKADRLAASQDRLQPAPSQRERRWGSAGLANIFYPSLKYEGGAPSREEIVGAAKALNELLRRAGSEAEAYHLLYAFLEPVWGMYTKNKVGPADTRVPHHSIFDHLYATAAAVNWSLSEEGNDYSGYMVHLDFPGIQGFISPARRLSDYWAGSWFVSLAMWYVVSEVVERFGPDVLVMPTARMNPFYYWHVYKSLVNMGGLRDDLKERLKRLQRYLLPDGWPMQPVVPGTVTLMLPAESPPSGGSWEEYFEERLKRFWRNVVLVSKSVWEKAFGEGSMDFLEVISENPPLQLVAVPVLARFTKDEMEERPVYADKAREAARGGKSRFRRAVGVGVDWESLTRAGEGGGGDKVYRMCSVCRSLPGFVRRTREGFQVWRPGEGYVPISPVDERLASVLLKVGESLCPYCMVKRAFARREAVERLLQLSFELKNVSVGSFVFPSTGDVAVLDFKIRLLRGLLNNGEAAGEIVREISEALRKAFSEESEEYREWEERVEEAGETKGLPYIPLKPLYEELSKEWGQGLTGEGDLWKLVYALVVREAEPFILGSASRVVLGVLRRHGVVGRGDGPALYYAIVKADGDGIGDVIGGRLAFVGDVEEYYNYLYKGFNDIDKDRVDSIVRKVKDLLEKLREDGCESRPEDRVIPPTPSYHASLSRAMVAASLEDIDVVRRHGGFVVYAGGDDLAALLPVLLGGEPAALEAVVESRSKYWGVEGTGGYRGFIVKLGTVVPALLGGGRSYGVRISHYRDPMNWEIEAAEDLLEGCAKKVREGLLRKDSVAFGYGRGVAAAGEGGGVLACGEWVEVLPNWNPRASGSGSLEEAYGPGMKGLSAYVRAAGNVWGLVRDEKLSTSFLYDVERHRDFINEVAGEEGVYALKVLLNITERNARGEGEALEAEKVISGIAKASARFQGVWLPLRVTRVARFLGEGVRSGGA